MLPGRNCQKKESLAGNILVILFCAFITVVFLNAVVSTFSPDYRLSEKITNDNELIEATRKPVAADSIEITGTNNDLLKVISIDKYNSLDRISTIYDNNETINYWLLSIRILSMLAMIVATFVTITATYSSYRDNKVLRKINVS